jgi:hypothetical protein
MSSDLPAQQALGNCVPHVRRPKHPMPTGLHVHPNALCPCGSTSKAKFCWGSESHKVNVMRKIKALITAVILLAAFLCCSAAQARVPVGRMIANDFRGRVQLRVSGGHAPKLRPYWSFRPFAVMRFRPQAM